MGRQSDEGGNLLPAPIDSEEAYDAFLPYFFPTGPQSLIDKFKAEIYPRVFNGTYPWRSQQERAADTLEDGITLTCAVHWVPKALQKWQKGVLGNKHDAWAYMFSVPGNTQHGYDILSTFYDGPEGNPVAVPDVATTHQRFLTNFIKNGNPNIGAKVPNFERYDAEKGNWLLNYTLDDAGKAKFVKAKDPGANPRCDWWEEVNYPHYVV
jgi:acetylcholinesterase